MANPHDAEPAASGGGVLGEMERALPAVGSLDLIRAAHAWGSAPEEGRPADPDLLAAWADRLVGAGASLLAVDVAREGLRHAPGHVRLRQLAALALARSGAAHDARGLAEALRAEGHEDAETLGILARAYKDLGLSAGEGAERRRWMAMARDTYAASHHAWPEDVWTGVNAATLCAWLGDAPAATRFAAAVRDRCLAQRAGGPAAADPYWLLATLGEAELVLGRLEEASRWYREARRHARGRDGDVASSRRNARLLAGIVPGAAEVLESWFDLPTVVPFAGHMVDQPGRPRPRFPAELVPDVAARLARSLDEIGRAVTYSSAACGADILFLEEAQRRGLETHVVLPYDRASFAKDSVDIGVPGDWRRRFDDVLARATTVTAVSPQRMRWGSVSYECANLMVLGLARAHARRLGTRCEGLVAWDREPGDGPGGTAWIVDLWRSKGLRVRIVDIAALAAARPGAVPAATPGPPPAAAPVPAPSEEPFETRIRTLLFADVKGFSRLNEWQVPVFVREVLGRVARLASESPWRPEVRNTWGDGLYLVFETARAAGLFALALTPVLEEARPHLHGFPPDFGIRVAVHTGPVYAFRDPVTGLATYGGSHVSLAARIEPVAPPGHVYASQWFAAAAELEEITEFACDYVGVTELAKGYGRFPTWHVRRTGPPPT